MEHARFFEELPFADLLGVEVIKLNDGYAKGKIEMREELSWSTDEMRAHSGVIFTLTEVTGAAALVSLHDPPVFTVDIDIKYLNSARGDLTSEAEVVRDGEHIGITKVTTFDENQTEISTATIVLQIN